MFVNIKRSNSLDYLNLPLVAPGSTLQQGRRNILCIWSNGGVSVKGEKEKMEKLQLEKAKSETIFLYTFFKVILSFSLSMRADTEDWT